MPKSNQPRIGFSRTEFLALTAIPVNRFTTMNRRGQIPFVDANMPNEVWRADTKPDPDPNARPFAYNFDFEMQRIDNKDAIAEDPRYLQHFPEEARKHRRYSADDAFAYIIADNLAREGGISRELAAKIAGNSFGYLRTTNFESLEDVWLGAVFLNDNEEGPSRQPFAKLWADIKPYCEWLAGETGQSVFRVVAVSAFQSLETLRQRAHDQGIELPETIPAFQPNEARDAGA